MRTRNLGWKEKLLLALIAVTFAMWAREGMRPSPESVIELRALASKNEVSRQMLDREFAKIDELKVGDVRRLRDQVTRIQEAENRLSSDPAARAMAAEWKRVDALSFGQMSWDDFLKWCLLSAKPYAPWVLGGLASAVALLVMRRLQKA